MSVFKLGYETELKRVLEEAIAEYLGDTDHTKKASKQDGKRRAERARDFLNNLSGTDTEIGDKLLALMRAIFHPMTFTVVMPRWGHSTKLAGLIAGKLVHSLDTKGIMPTFDSTVFVDHQLHSCSFNAGPGYCKPKSSTEIVRSLLRVELADYGKDDFRDWKDFEHYYEQMKSALELRDLSIDVFTLAGQGIADSQNVTHQL